MIGLQNTTGNYKPTRVIIFTAYSFLLISAVLFLMISIMNTEILRAVKSETSFSLARS